MCVHVISNHFNKFTTSTSRNFFIAKMFINSSFFDIHIFSISIMKNRRHDLLLIFWRIFLNCIMVYLLILLYFLSVMSFLIISKLMIFLCLKCRSVFSKNSLHLFLAYYVSSPSFSNHFKSLGTNGGTNLLSTFQVRSD